MDVLGIASSIEWDFEGDLLGILFLLRFNPKSH